MRRTAPARQNLVTPAAAIETRGQQVVRVDGAFDDLSKIRDLGITTKGNTLRLSEISTIERGYEHPATFVVRSEGELALLLGVVMREDWNGLDLGTSLRE